MMYVHVEALKSIKSVAMERLIGMFFCGKEIKAK
jgi:hypothetical protein